MNTKKERIPYLNDKEVLDILNSNLTTKEKGHKIAIYIDDINARSTDGYYKNQSIDLMIRLAGEWEEDNKG